MCLNKIDCSGTEPVKEGWKVFEKEIKSDTGISYLPLFFGKALRENKWEIAHKRSLLDKPLKENYPRQIHAGDGRYYESGFHVFHDKGDAIRIYRRCTDRVLRKVLVEDPICVGYQDKCLVTVARKIKVLSEDESK